MRGSHGRPPDLEPRRPALIVAGDDALHPDGDEVDMTAVPGIILGLLDYRA